MFKLLNQPYPCADAPLWQLRKSAIIGLFVGLFLLTFQPFGLNLWETSHKALKLMGFGAVTFVVTALNFILWQWLFPRQFAEEKWTVGREILFVTGNILLIGIANRFYLDWLLGKIEDSGLDWSGIILVTFLIGLFPVTGLVLINYIAQLRKYSREAAELPVHPVEPSSVHQENETLATPGVWADDRVKFVADNEKDTLTIQPSDLLYVESSDNYSTVVYLKNGQPAKPLLRSSLSRLEGQIAELPNLRTHIVRCHRSYIVNLNRVERVTGNAQGYKLHLLGGQFVVPVARKYNDTLVAELKAL